MESWREELYSNSLCHYGIFGQRKGKGKKYGYRSHTRNAEGAQERAERENVHGNGRGMEDQKLLTGIKSVEYVPRSDTYYDTGYTDNSKTSNGANNDKTSSNASAKEEPKKEEPKEEPKKEEPKEEPKKEEPKEKPKKEEPKEKPKKEEPAKVIQKNAAALGANNSVTNLNSNIKTIISGIDNKRISGLPDADLSKYSNDELEAMTKRANLEANYRKATAPGESKTAKGAKAVTDIMTGLIGAGLAGMAIAKVYKILKDD